MTTATKPGIPPLRCCLLSGGASQRMGQDKALLPHPDGGTWLEHTLRLLAELDAPITLLSRWPQHHALAEALQLPQLETLIEPPPWEGPLLALHRLMERYPDARLLLAPVDMPGLNGAALHALVATGTDPAALHPGHDGRRLQPLLGIYPSSPEIRRQLSATVRAGERRLQRWIASQPCQPVVLDSEAIHNANRPDDVQPIRS